jgi:hypothetical protein
MASGGPPVEWAHRMLFVTGETAACGHERVVHQKEEK